MKIDKKFALTIVAALVVGGTVGYVLPRGSSAKNASGFAAGGRGGAYFTRGNQAMGGLLAGSIAKMDSASLTLNTRDGSSHVVLLTPDTQVEKSVAGSASDLSIGENVIVSGTTNGDGSVSANSISVRPAESASGTNAPMIPAPQPQ